MDMSASIDRDLGRDAQVAEDLPLQYSPAIVEEALPYSNGLATVGFNTKLMLV